MHLERTNDRENFKQSFELLKSKQRQFYKTFERNIRLLLYMLINTFAEISVDCGYLSFVFDYPFTP